MPTVTSTSTDTIVELLSHLVRFPTMSKDRATNQVALDWVEEQLSHLPLKFHRYEHQGFASLVATTPAVTDPKNPRLWLAAHMDVVEGPPAAFVPRVENGRLHGRGTHDM